MNTPSLSLYRIDIELLELMHAREDILAATDMTPQEQADSIAAIDNQVTQYLANAIENRADEAGNYIRECETRAEVKRTEAKRLIDAARLWEEQQRYVENILLQLMQRAGKKRIEGPMVTLALKNNPPSCEVVQPDLVPEPYLRTTVTLSVDLLNRLLSHLMATEKGAPLFQELMPCKQSAPEAVKSEILKELKGGVSVPGCRLKDDSVRLEIK